MNLGFTPCNHCELPMVCRDRNYCTQSGIDGLIKPSIPLHPRSSPVAPASHDIRRVVRGVQLYLDEVDILVLRTPTGGVRNTLTEAAMHLQVALVKLAELA